MLLSNPQNTTFGNFSFELGETFKLELFIEKAGRIDVFHGSRVRMMDTAGIYGFLLPLTY